MHKDPAFAYKLLATFGESDCRSLTCTKILLSLTSFWQHLERATAGQVFYMHKDPAFAYKLTLVACISPNRRAQTLDVL